MSLRRFLALWTIVFTLLVPAWAAAQALQLDGSVAAQAVCPGGGTPVDRLCRAQGAASDRRGCMYGGEHTFDSVELTNGAVLCVTPYDGVDKVGTGNLVLKSLSTITIDESSKVSAKGAGYQGALCDDGPGPTPAAGGKGGCSVFDSGGGGAHFGQGGRGTKDCFLVGSTTSCQFPDEFEEDCGSLVNGACVTSPDPACYGGGADPQAGDAQPSVAGQPFRHNILDIEFGAAGGDKGCRDGFDGNPRAGDGGGRVVLFAANATQTGAIDIRGSIIANGARGCSSGNDSAGGGAGGTVLVVGDFVSVGSTAIVAAHGGRGGDSQMKCLPCTTAADCGGTGQACTNGMCAPCNCTPCTSNAQCSSELGQTCRDIDGGGSLPSICVDASNACTPFDPGEDELECAGTQVTGTCDDCGGAGGGGILNIQSRLADIHPSAVFNVRGGKGGICPICSGEAGGGAGELQIDSAYVGEICDGYDNDFNGMVDEGLGTITCPNGDVIAACAAGLPQTCVYDAAAIAACEVPATDARPRFSLIVDTSGSMLDDLAGVPTYGDGSEKFPGVDTGSDADALDGNNSRLFIAKDALTQVLSSFPESDYALARYYQDVGVNRSCQTASNFECAASCCSYDDPRDNLPPPYPSTHPDNFCVLNQLYPTAGYPADPAFNANMAIGWPSEAGEMPATSSCINYAGSCGPPRRGAQYVVGFDQPITRYLSWLDGAEDDDVDFDASVAEGDHCPDGDCELRGTGPTPLGNALEATYDFLTPAIACDGAKECRSYTTILLTDGAESCDGDPATAAAELFNGVSGKAVRTYVIGFSVLPSEEASLNAIAAAGGTGAAIFVDDKDELANALAQIIGQDQRFELCNDADDDCDDLVDEDFPEKGEPCTDGELGVCAGTGTFQCTLDQLGTACVIDDPGAAPGVEVCNGLDDDCDGYVDEDENNQPLDCSNCVATPEVCDGIDNDCDLSIDEEDDVFTNQPEEYGIACGELTAPNDQPPCALGVVRCINGGPLCIGFKGPGVEICNALDDDCDGVGDEEAACPGETQCVSGQCVFECSAGEFPCPAGYECKQGFCFQRSCDDVTCDVGQTCVAGLCVDDQPTGQGGGAGEGGGAGQGGATSVTGAGGATATSSTATGPTTTTTATGGPTGDNFGLVTGGGGLKCAVGAVGDGGGSTRGLAWALVALAVAVGSRRVRRGGAR